jgi:hypothetical protein
MSVVWIDHVGMRAGAFDEMVRHAHARGTEFFSGGGGGALNVLEECSLAAWMSVLGGDDGEVLLLPAGIKQVLQIARTHTPTRITYTHTHARTHACARHQRG